MALTITNNNFEAEVLNSELPVLVDFWAPWCGPCRMVGPIIEELAEELEGKVKVGKINVDDEGELAVKYSVMSIPTLAFFKGGKTVFVEVGAKDKQSILELIENA